MKLNFANNSFSTDDLRKSLESAATRQNNKTTNAKDYVNQLAKNVRNSNAGQELLNKVRPSSAHSSFNRMGNFSASRDIAANIREASGRPMAIFEEPGVSLRSMPRALPGGPQFSEQYNNAFGSKRSPFGFGLDVARPPFDNIIGRKVARFPSVKRKSMSRLNGFPFLLDLESDYLNPPENTIYTNQIDGSPPVKSDVRFGLGGIAYLTNHDVPVVNLAGNEKLLNGIKTTYEPDKDGKKGLGVAMNNYYNLACIETDFIIKTNTVPDEYDYGFCYNPDISNENSNQNLQVVSHDFDVVESFSKDHFVAWLRDYPEQTGHFIDPQIYKSIKDGIVSQPLGGQNVYNRTQGNEFPSLEEVDRWEPSESHSLIDNKDGTFTKPFINVINGEITLPEDGLAINSDFKIAIGPAGGQKTLYSISSASAINGLNRHLHANKIVLDNTSVTITNAEYKIWRPIYEAKELSELTLPEKERLSDFTAELANYNEKRNDHGVLADEVNNDTRLIEGSGALYSSLFWHGKNFGTPMPVDFFAPITIQPANTGAFVITLDSGVANYFESRDDFGSKKPFNCNLMFDYGTDCIDFEGFIRRSPEYYTAPYKGYIIPAKGWDFDVVGSLVKGVYYEYPFNPEDRILTKIPSQNTRSTSNSLDVPVFTHQISGNADVNSSNFNANASRINYNNLPLTHMPFNYGPGKGWKYRSEGRGEILLKPYGLSSEQQIRNGEGPYDTALTHGENNKIEFYAPETRVESVLSEEANSLNNPIYSDDERPLSSQKIVGAHLFNQSRLLAAGGGIRPPLSRGFVDETQFPKTSNLKMRSALKEPLRGSTDKIGTDRSISIKIADFSTAIQPDNIGAVVCGCGGGARSSSARPKPGRISTPKASTKSSFFGNLELGGGSFSKTPVRRVNKF